MVDRTMMVNRIRVDELAWPEKHPPESAIPVLNARCCDKSGSSSTSSAPKQRP